MLGETAVRTARNALRPGEDDDERAAHDEAVEVLADFLAGGPMPAEVVKRLVAEAGVSARTLDRAKKTLGVRSVKVGQPGEEDQAWRWELSEERQRPPKKRKGQKWPYALEWGA